MPSTTNAVESTWRIGALAAETGLTVRTLHHYDAIGLIRPSARTSGGHRVYTRPDVERLYAALVLRSLGVPLTEIAARMEDPTWDLRTAAARQRAELDAQIEAISRLRQRVDALLPVAAGATADAASADAGSDNRASASSEVDPTSVIREMQRAAARPFAVRQVLALLPYEDVEAAQRRLVDMFAFEAGTVTRDDTGTVVHAEVLAGRGFVHLHPPTAYLASPGADGVASAAVVASVSDVDEHAARAVSRGGRLLYGPADMPYGVREYGVRDHEGHPWSFQAPLPERRT
jgi:MerR family transcriptional regulator, thiopeptide resistance regulator